MTELKGKTSNFKKTNMKLTTPFGHLTVFYKCTVIKQFLGPDGSEWKASMVKSDNMSLT